MTRVSENSKSGLLDYNLSRAKEKLEGLQIKGSSLKRIARLSDDPAGSVNLLALRSQLTDNKQFVRNLNYVKSHLELTENAISDLFNILARAKEVSIAQASDTVNPEVRESVAEEINQLLKQMTAIGNRKMGRRYLFGGYMTHQRPFDHWGGYLGDDGKSFVEIKKDFFVPINLSGSEVFFTHSPVRSSDDGPLREALLGNSEFRDSSEKKRGLAPIDPLEPGATRSSLFDLLRVLRNSVRRGDSDKIQNLLGDFDRASSQLITLRTQLGAIQRSIESAEEAIGVDDIAKSRYRSTIEDADVSDLFSELEKQNNVLRAAYKTGASLVTKSLLDFL